MLTRRRLLWPGPSGSFMDFGFSAGFFLNSSVEEELDLFVQRPMLLFSASSAIRGIPPGSNSGVSAERNSSFSGMDHMGGFPRTVTSAVRTARARDAGHVMA